MVYVHICTKYTILCATGTMHVAGIFIFPGEFFFFVLHCINDCVKDNGIIIVVKFIPLNISIFQLYTCTRILGLGLLKKIQPYYVTYICKYVKLINTHRTIVTDL